MTIMLAEWVFTSIFLILAVLALRAAFGRRVSARLRYALWAVVLVRLLVPVQLFTSPIAGTRVFSGDRTEQSIHKVTGGGLEQGGQHGIPALGGQGGPEAVLDTFPQAPGVPALPDAPEPPSPPDFTKAPAWLGWIWLGGSAAMALVLAASNLRFARRLRRCRIRMDGTDCPLPVYAAVGLPSPCLFGLARPAVYVTPEAAADPVMLRHVIAHEYTHFRHGDHLWSFLRCAALAAHWWNPLVWLAVTLSRRDGELACDEGALGLLGDGERMAYGNTLLALVTAKPSPGDLLCFATTMAGEKHSLKERVSRIACAPRRWLWAAVAVVLAAALACACAFGQAAEQDAPDVPWPYDVSELVYVRDKGGFGGDFSIRLNKDGSFTYYAGPLSSYIGMGTWTRDGDVICLADEGRGDRIQRYYFRDDGGDLVFQAENSAEFMYVDVADGDRFSRKSSESGQQEELNPSAVPETPSPNVWHADLDRDGAPETIEVVSLADGMGQKVQVTKGGRVIWSDEGDSAHGGWNAVFLCTLNGKDYLLRYNPYMQQGWCSYSYQLFTLTQDGEEQTARTNRVAFDINFGPMHESFDAEAIAAFIDEVNGLLANSVQLINTDDNLLGTFQSEGRLYDSLWWLYIDDFVPNRDGTMMENLWAYRDTMEGKQYSEIPTVFPVNELGTDIRLNYQDRQTHFEGLWDYHYWPDSKAELLDLNRDGKDEIMVSLLGLHGTGAYIENLYLFDAQTLEQYDTSGVVDMILSQVTSYADEDQFYLSAPGLEAVIPKSVLQDDCSYDYTEQICFENIHSFYVEEGRLYASFSAGIDTAGLNYVGSLKVELRMDGNRLVCAEFSYQPNS